MLPNWKTQYRSRSRQSKLKLSHIMAELSAFHEFEFFEVFKVQTTYKHQLMHKLINIHLVPPNLDLSIIQTWKITNQCQTQISESKKSTKQDNDISSGSPCSSGIGKKKRKVDIKIKNA